MTDPTPLNPAQALEASNAFSALAAMMVAGGDDPRLIACAAASAALALLTEVYGPSGAERIFVGMAPTTHAAHAEATSAGRA